MNTTLEAEEIAPAIPTFQVPKITLDDVCDSCGVKPAVVAYNPNNGYVFMYCIHHGLKNETALGNRGFIFEPALPKDIRKIN